MTTSIGRRLLGATAAFFGFVLVPSVARAQADPVAVPNLQGMTVKAANAALEDAGLQGTGERLELRTDKNGRALFAAASASKTVTSQSVKPGAMRPRGTLIALGTGERGRLRLIGWRRIAYRHGRVILRQIDPLGCTSYDHVALSPAVNGARQITVWGLRAPRCGKRLASTVVVETSRSWKRSTLGVPWTPTVPDASWNVNVRSLPASAILMPDRRTVFATYIRSACERMTAASATLDGTTGELRVLAGNQAGTAPDAPCALGGIEEGVLIRLPRVAPAGTTFTSAAS